jgi:hypothetical protein
MKGKELLLRVKVYGSLFKRRFTFDAALKLGELLLRLGELVNLKPSQVDMVKLIPRTNLNAESLKRKSWETNEKL